MSGKAEVPETLYYLAKTNDFKELLEKLSLKQLYIIENVLSMYEHDELIVVNNDYEILIDYANKPDEMFPYKTVITWYEGLTSTEDLIEFMNDICL